MASLDDLIEFIEGSPSLNALWGEDKWEMQLSKSIPNWREFIKTFENWDEIENVRPKGNYSQLCDVLVGVGGLKLAKRWFDSEESNQRYAARRWLCHHASIDVPLWQECDKNMKDALLEDRFRHWPDESFKMLDTHIAIIRRRARDIGCVDLSIAGYVPSPQLERLRNIIENAGDQEYLTRIDRMITRREKVRQVISSQRPQQIPHMPNSNERELIARVMEITRRSGYLPAALPPILISFETPPIFIAYPELEEEDDDEYQIRRNRDQRRDEKQIPRNRQRRSPETISIEELLGVYRSRYQQIVIYERGIKWRRHRYDEEWILAVVLIHEIGHWITHVLSKPGVPTWSTDLFALSEMDVKEGWAQLITWWIAEQVGGPFKETFDELNQNQSPPYHVFERFKNEPIDKVMDSLEKLRLLSYPARLQDWKQALR